MLSKDEEAKIGEIGGLLAAALRTPERIGVPLKDRLDIMDVVRRWLWIVLVATLMVGAEVQQRMRNTLRIDHLEVKMREVRPLVRRHEWQVQQGLTNHDLKERGITAPEFKEDE